MERSRDRWEEFKQRLVEQNPCVSLSGLGRAGAEWLGDGRVFAVPHGDDLPVPEFQLRDGQPHFAAAADLGHLIAEREPWTIQVFFTTRDMWACGGRNPRDLLDEDPAAVIEAARHSVAETWD